VFERFTDRARRAVHVSEEEARSLGHNYIGTEHLLLALTREGQGPAALALARLGVSRKTVRRRVREIAGQGQNAPSGHIPFTPRAKKVLELSLREALQCGHNYIGTEHLLLGLLREGEGVAARVLTGLGADLTTVRREVLALLHGAPSAGPAKPPAADPFPDAAVLAAEWSRLETERWCRLEAVALRLYRLVGRLGDDEILAPRSHGGIPAVEAWLKAEFLAAYLGGSLWGTLGEGP